MAFLMQAACFFLIVLFLLVEALLLALYFLLHLLTALARFALLSTTGAGLVDSGTASAGAGRTGAAAGGGVGAITLNVLVAVVGCTWPPCPTPEGVVLAWSA